MAVDGRIGFIGGVGLADKWNGDAQDPGHWRDTHFQVGGPVVAQMQSAFLDNWLAATGEVLRGDAYFPPLDAAGEQTAQAFSASPGGGSKTMQLLYLMSITAARESIELSASYFIPDEVAKASLAAAARRGVRVRIIVPGPHMDVAIVRHASRHNWGPLLEAGVEIYEYQPTMFHCKVIVVDGALDVGRLDQLRQPLVQRERRNQHERLRRGICAAAARGVRAGPAAHQPDFTAALAGPPRFTENTRLGRILVQLPAMKTEAF